MKSHDYYIHHEIELIYSTISVHYHTSLLDINNIDYRTAVSLKNAIINRKST